jgi:hypothetical protein
MTVSDPHPPQSRGGPPQQPAAAPQPAPQAVPQNSAERKRSLGLPRLAGPRGMPIRVWGGPTPREEARERWQSKANQLAAAAAKEAKSSPAQAAQPPPAAPQHAPEHHPPPAENRGPVNHESVLANVAGSGPNHQQHGMDVIATGYDLIGLIVMAFYAEMTCLCSLLEVLKHLREQAARQESHPPPPQQAPEAGNKRSPHDDARDKSWCFN